jgi:hypothetical protein
VAKPKAQVKRATLDVMTRIGTRTKTAMPVQKRLKRRETVAARKRTVKAKVRKNMNGMMAKTAWATMKLCVGV